MKFANWSGKNGEGPADGAGRAAGKTTEKSEAAEAAPPAVMEILPVMVKQMELISLTAEDLAIIRQYKPVVDQNIDFIVNAFYDAVTNVEELKDIIVTHSTLERLKQTLRIHVAEMFIGTIDEAFLAKRDRVAKAHVRIGLKPKWYIAAFQRLQEALLDTVLRERPSSGDLVRFIRVTTKILNFEQQLVLEAYEKEEEAKRQEIYRAAREDTKRAILHVSSELAALTQQLYSSIETMSAYGRDVNTSVDGSVQSSRSLRETAVSGGRQVSELEQLMVTLNGKFVRMEQVLRQLNDHSGQIGEISKGVMGIASQTRLLSFNAAIEAARAGEHGRGFGVVAREVRKLSEETARSVADISQVIEESLLKAREAAASVEEVKRFVAEGEQKSVATQDAFGDIVSAIDESMVQVRGAEQKMRELLHVIDEIDAAARKVAESADDLHQTANSL